MPRPDETKAPTVESKERDGFYGDVIIAGGAIAVAFAGVAASLVEAGVKRVFENANKAHGMTDVSSGDSEYTSPLSSTQESATTDLSGETKTTAPYSPAADTTPPTFGASAGSLPTPHFNTVNTNAYRPGAW